RLEGERIPACLGRGACSAARRLRGGGLALDRVLGELGQEAVGLAWAVDEEELVAGAGQGHVEELAQAVGLEAQLVGALAAVAGEEVVVAEGGQVDDRELQALGGAHGEDL